jgi:hypothetical protein
LELIPLNIRAYGTTTESQSKTKSPITPAKEKKDGDQGESQKKACRLRVSANGVISGALACDRRVLMGIAGTQLADPIGMFSSMTAWAGEARFLVPCRH